ncbi:hypothetical protein, partial [Belliella aquatica]
NFLHTCYELRYKACPEEFRGGKTQDTRLDVLNSILDKNLKTLISRESLLNLLEYPYKENRKI